MPNSAEGDARSVAADLHVQATYRLTEALVASENRMRRRIELLSEIVFETDAQGVLVFLNKAWTKTLGHATEASLGQPLSRFILGEDRPAYEAARRSPATHRLVRLVRADGGVSWMEMSASELVDGGAVGALHDITTIKLAEEELIKLSLVASYTDNLVVITDREGRTEWVNQSFIRRTGYTLADVAGRKPGELLQGPATDPETVKRIHRLLEEGSSFEAEILNYSRAGEPYWVLMHISPIRAGDGRIQRFVAIQTDITERKRTEDRMRQMEQEQAWQAALFRTSLDTLSECVVVSDLSGKPYYWNRSALELYGYGTTERAREMLPQFDELFELVLPGGEVVPHEEWPLARAIRGERIRDWECTLRHRREKWERLFVHSATLAHDLSGKPLLAVLSMVEVTARRNLEHQLRQSQKMEAIGQLASGIAHDLNNILSPILMGSEILQQTRDGGPGADMLAIISREAQRGGAIIKQLLAFSRGWEGERVVVDPEEVAKDILDIARETFSRAIVLDRRIPAKPWNVLADPTQLHQVLLNLCVNARDAMPDGGRLTIAISNVTLSPGDPALPPAGSSGPYVMIEVQDTGVGISPEIKDRIFDPFFTTKPVGQGTGLGLSTVMGIVRGHGGFLHVDSTPQMGASFKVYLPATDVEERPAAAVPSVAGRSARDHHILVVDDEASVRETTKAALMLRGYRVSTASNGEEGLREYRLHAGTISLLLTDLMMPVMDGMALIRAVRAENPGLPILASSGFTEVEKMGGLDAVGIQAFLPKPFSIFSLLETVGKHLPQ